MVLALIVNKTRQSPERNRIPAGAFERFHIADAGFRERLQFEIDLRARSSGKFAPLADGGGRKLNLSHMRLIA
jgi:hypothetical protein